MNVVVFGASGRTGRLVVEQALEKGHAVTAFVRNRDSFSLEHPKLRVLEGDARDAAAVQTAVAGQQAVVSTIGPYEGKRFEPISSTSIEHIIAAMKRQGVSRLLAVTAAADMEAGFLYDKVVRPLLLKRVFDDKELEERAIFKSGLDWTIVRPPILRDGPRTGAYRLAIGNPPPGGWRIRRADVADFIVKELGRKDYIHQALVIAY